MTTNHTKCNQKQPEVSTFCNLTEQWKKGELDRGIYYIKEQGSYKTDEWHGNCWEDSWSENVEEVLAPIPSYEEWMRIKDSLDDYKRLCDMRGKIIDKMDESNEDTVKHLRQENAQLIKFLEEFNTLDVAKENQQLKELLRECLDVFSNHVSPFYSYCQWQKYPCVDTEDFYQDTKAICKIIDKIDNAIGEKK